MAVRVISGVTFGSANAMEFTVTEVTGSLSFLIRIDETGVSYDAVNVSGLTKWSHESMAALPVFLPTLSYGTLAIGLKDALDTASAAVGNSLTYTVVWSTTNLGYTISATGAGIDTIDFGVDDAGQHARGLLGFQNDSISSPFVSDRVASYANRGEMGCKSNPTEVYEPDGVAEGGFTQGGSTFGVGVIEATLFDDFDLMFESKAATYKNFAAQPAPFTWQHFWEHTRVGEPFIVADDIDARAYFHRPDFARFIPDRAVANWDGYFHLLFRCYMLGYVGGTGGIVEP